MKHHIPSLSVLLACILPVSFAMAQEQSAADTNMEILKEKLKGDKKLLIAANMDLTDTEAKDFWPIYEEYQKDLQSLNERIRKAIESYATEYTEKTLTDESAGKLLAETMAIDESEVQMRKGYAERLAKVVPGKKVARYMQIENKIRAVVRYALAAEIPLVP